MAKYFQGAEEVFFRDLGRLIHYFIVLREQGSKINLGGLSILLVGIN